jgi:2'-5' RNA ligase
MWTTTVAMQTDAPRPLAIELAFDEPSTRRLARLWSDLAALHDARGHSELGVRPHVTLAVFRDGEPRDVGALLAALAADVAPFALSLDAVASFPGDEGVVYLRPAASSELAYAHVVLDRALGAERTLVHPYYRPGAWQPHCTAAVDVPAARMGLVLDACRAADVLGEVRVERVQVVRYRPATEVAGFTWSSPKAPNG